MKFLLFFALIFLSLDTHSDDNHSEFTIDNSSPLGQGDEAGSLFLEFLKKNKNKLPEKGMNELIEQFSKWAESSGSKSVSIPDTRSLQRGHTSEAFPRSVTAFEGGKSSASPPLYLGFSPLAKQMEVISWNPRTSKYDFFIVQNFGPGLSPRVNKVERQVCLKCHQHGGPIFTRFPWKETDIGSFNAGAGQDFKSYEAQEKIRQTGSAEERELLNFTRGGGGAGTVIAFDQLVRRSSHFLQTAKACQMLCETKECKKALIGLMVIQASRTNSTTGVGTFFNAESDNLFMEEVNRRFATLISKWPEDGLAYPTSVLPDRDPKGQVNNGGTITGYFIRDQKKFMTSILSDQAQQSRVLASSLDPKITMAGAYEELSEIDLKSIPGVVDFPFAGPSSPKYSTSPGNPATPRTLVGKLTPQNAGTRLMPFLKMCFGLVKNDLDSLAGISQERALNIAFESNFFDSLVAPNMPWPPQRAAVMLAINEAVSASYKKDAEILGCAFVEEAVPKVLDNDEMEILKKIDHISLATLKAAAVETTPKESMPHFQKYCQRCHQGAESVIDLPLPAKNAKEFSTWNEFKNYGMGGSSSPFEKLRLKEMPPVDSEEGKLLEQNPEEYKKMIDTFLTN